MRFLATLLLLAAPVLADDAADLFYRAFWMEQSGQNAAEAEKLYRELIEKHADAPEAPRAYLALIRMDSARGVKVDDMLRALEKGYPQAKKEIELARRLAARLNVAFDAVIRADDSPLERKLKTVYKNLVATGKLEASDQDFLIDVGAAGHPMLSAALRSSEDGAAYFAAYVLLRQKTEAADAVVLRALRDENVLYRLRIMDALRGPALSRRLVDGLAEIWPRASRSLRVRIAKVWMQQTRGSNPLRDDCFRHLVLALEDEAPDVRIEALSVNPQAPYDVPVEWTKAAMKLLPSPDGRAAGAERILPWQVRHESIRAAVEEELIEREGSVWFQYPNMSQLPSYGITEEMAKSWARIALARSARNPDLLSSNSTDYTRGLVWIAAASSRTVARELLAAGLERADLDLLSMIRQGARPQGDEDLGDLTGIRRDALEQWYSEDEKRHQAANYLLGMSPLTADDLPTVIATAKANEGKGLPWHAKSNSFLKLVGPEGAAALVPCATEKEIDTLMSSGMVFLGASADDGLPFWKAILPRAKAPHASLLQGLARNGSAAVKREVARRMLGARGKDWKWRTEEKLRSQYNVGGPAVLRLLTDALDGPELYPFASDERFEIGRWALTRATKDSGEEALVAYRAAMASPFWEMKESALKGLGRRGDQGAAQLEAILKDPELSSPVRNKALGAFSRAAGEEQLPFVKARLDARPDGLEAAVMWSLAFTHDRDATVERAFREVFGEGPKEYRDEALDVLRRTSDERRIPVFRKVLREDADEARIHRVLNTVAEQYLIELGPEVLLHLRNPNDGIRQTATKAIERLKFYAEAKKLFEDGKE